MKLFPLVLALLPCSASAMAQVLELQPEAVLSISPAVNAAPLGSAVAINGQQVLVGSPQDSAGGMEVGAAYLYERVNGVWVTTAKLVPTGAAACSHYGSSVALNGDVAVLRARATHEGLAPECSTGQSDDTSAIVFERGSNGWVQTARFVAARGLDVEASGDSIAIGLTGSDGGGVGLYRRLGFGVWSAQTYIPGEGDGGAAPDFPGPDFDLEGNTLAIGAIRCPTECAYAVYDELQIYERDGDGVFRLQVRDLEQTFTFGRTSRTPIAISGDYVAAGEKNYKRTGPGEWQRISSFLSPNFGFVAVKPVQSGLFAQTFSVYNLRDPSTFRQQYSLAVPDAGGLGGNVLLSAADGSLLAQWFGAGDGSRRILLYRLPEDLEPPAISEARTWPEISHVGRDVQLTAFANESGTGGATIAAMEYQISDDPWRPMQALDGAFDEVFETGSVVLPPTLDALSRPGIQTICFRARDVHGNESRPGSLLGPACVELPVAARNGGSDRRPPVVSEPQMYRSTMSREQDNEISLFADDSATGGSAILLLQYRIGDDTWRPVAEPRHYELDSPFKGGSAIFGPLDRSGHTQVCVRAIDESSNVSAVQCLPLVVTD